MVGSSHYFLLHGKDWRQEEKGTTENEMVGWHHRHDAHEFEWAPGVGGGQGSLACCGPWGHKESDTTEHLDWTEVICASVEGQLTELPPLWFCVISQLCKIQSRTHNHLHPVTFAASYWLEEAGPGSCPSSRGGKYTRLWKPGRLRTWGK